MRSLSKQLQRFLLLSFSLLLLVGCGLLEDFGIGDEEEGNLVPNASEENQNQDSGINSISDLEDTDYFRDGTLAHILEGELNGRGQAVGFHFEGMQTKKGEVIPDTASEPNEYGVYEAKVKVSGVEKKSNRGRSTFFPNDWTAQQVVNAINEAYLSKSYLTGNTYEGLTGDGIAVRMYIDENDKIISAFPIY